MRYLKVASTAPGGRPVGMLLEALRGLMVTGIVMVASACSSGFVRGGPSFDAGTLGVSGVETGFGSQVEAMGYGEPDGTGYGLGVSLQLAGFSTAGDADPIAFTTLEGRFRRGPGAGRDRGAYWELGTGLGLAWSPGLQRVAIPLQGEVGLQRRWAGTLVSLGMRERLLPMIGEGSPPFDVFNSLQLVVGIGLSR